MEEYTPRSRSSRFLGWTCLALASVGVAAALGTAPAGPALAQRAPGQPVANASDAADPPARVGRLSYISGTVSFRTQDMDYWEEAQTNYPLTVGNVFWTEPGARASMELGNGILRLDSSTEADILQFDDRLVQINVPVGTVNFRLRTLTRGETYQIVTPSGMLEMSRAGRYRVDSYDDGRPARISVIEGAADLVLDSGARITITGGQMAPISGDRRPAPPTRVQLTNFDTWSDQQDARFTRAPQYVSQNLPGIHDLGAYGAWNQSSDYGPIWYPTVAADWAPYRQGHWTFVAPWGWTWVDAAPWGFTPFHYGRWVRIQGRWAWLPGTVVARPVYAPALVVFFGGVSLSIGGGPSVGWFPLGPREVYVPPYRTSITYVRNVNITNVTNVNNITVNNITVNRTVNNFANVSETTVVAVSAMTSSRQISAERVNVRREELAAIEETRQAPAKPTRATRGASPAVIEAVGVPAADEAPARNRTSPGRAAHAKPLPQAIIRPLAPLDVAPPTRRDAPPPRADAPAQTVPPIGKAAPDANTPAVKREAATPRNGGPAAVTAPLARTAPIDNAPPARRGATPKADEPANAGPAVVKAAPNDNAPPAKVTPPVNDAAASEACKQPGRTPAEVRADCPPAAQRQR